MTNNDLNRSIGKRIRNLRVQKEYTQAQFAELMDISVNFLSEIENGKKGMSQETIYRLCKYFQISADYILFGTEPAPAGKTPRDMNKLINMTSDMDPEDLTLVIEYLVSLKNMKECRFGKND